MLQYALIALTPILLILDYILAFIELKLYRRSYGKHVVIDQDDTWGPFERGLKEGRWIGSARLVAVVLATTCIIILYYIDETIFYAFSGYALTLPLILSTNRLAHILFYRYVDAHQEEISGEARLSARLAYQLNYFRLLSPALLLGLIALVNPTPFTLGSLVAPLALAIKYALLIRKAKKVS